MRSNPLWGPALLVSFALITGAVAATQGASLSSGSDNVGICHATEDGSSVYLVVARDGADHAAHLLHADDVIDVDSEADCPQASTTAAQTTPLCGHTEPATTTGTGGAAAAAEPAAGTPQTTAAEEAADPALEGLCDADVALEHTSQQSGNWAIFTLRVTSAGTGEADDVRLQADLPDVGRAWQQTPSVTGCTIGDLSLQCEFGDLAAGAVRTVAVRAPRCLEDCGNDLEASARVLAYNDGDDSNNEAPATIVIPDCPRETATPTPSPDPAGNQTGNQSSNHTGSGNQTGNETGGNGTGNETGNETTNETTGNETAGNGSAAPTPGDAAVSQRVVQNVNEVILTIVVRSVGAGIAEDAMLQDTLPDVRRAWHLGGTDAGGCTLDGRYLNCAFGDIAGGESRTVQLKAYTDRLPCGEHLTNLVHVAATGDPRTENDRSTASIEARYC